MKVGVLALQGDFAEHLAFLHRLGAEGVEIRLPSHLDDIEALIIPGGESTTIGKLANAFDLLDPLRAFGQKRPIWGTCAGAIFLSKDTKERQHLLGLMDITVERNAFGRQVDSFESSIHVPVLDNPEMPFPAIFIRAPLIARVGPEADVLARLPESNDNGIIVAAKQGHFLATSFHPELTGDDRFHRYFLSLLKT
ncbi:MAG: pyridoxal 5'-phosphate synthase glutaminase subunit PdxT [Anaerolineales bacterium]|nr:pyridoxal 5'-phosphate synthase glutaminase subunit PdxT [Anaerolineales bacterium]MCK5633495.1 pyridoxal 5'-phosphate synthase glutaminase subunit PdxT [Anaerolineales bacterium]